MTVHKSWIEDPIYHYTKLNVFVDKVLPTKKLRLVSCNDVKNAPVENMALEAIITEALRNIPNKQNLIKELLMIRNNSYMTCFSKEENNNFLWKYYGEERKGVVIELDPKDEKFHESHGINLINGKRCCEPRLIDIEYNDNKFKKKINEYIDTNFQTPIELYVDSYKPVCCHLEKEVRLLFYLDCLESFNASDNEFTKHLVNINNVGNTRPKELFFDIDIKKVICSDKLTYGHLKDKLSNIQLEYIDF